MNDSEELDFESKPPECPDGTCWDLGAKAASLAVGCKGWPLAGLLTLGARVEAGMLRFPGSAIVDRITSASAIADMSSLPRHAGRVDLKRKGLELNHASVVEDKRKIAKQFDLIPTMTARLHLIVGGRPSTLSQAAVMMGGSALQMQGSMKQAPLTQDPWSQSLE